MPPAGCVMAEKNPETSGQAEPADAASAHVQDEPLTQDTPDEAPSQGAPDETPSQDAPLRQDTPPAGPPRRNRRWWLWLTISVLLLALPLTWMFVPKEVWMPYLKRLEPWRHQPAIPVPRKQPATAQTPPRITRTAPAPARIAPTTADVARLHDTIDALRRELEQTRRERRAFMSAMHRHQQADLRLRLHWITRPESGLAQISAYWEDITLLPALDEEDQARAENMLQLARRLNARVHNWRDRLTAIAGALPMPVAESIHIETDNRWLAWLASQFRLSTSPSREQRELQVLHRRIQRAAHQLAAGQWPEQARWQALLKDIRAQLGDTATAGLPQGFEQAQNEIRTMRQTAQHWLGRLAEDTGEATN